MSKVEGRGPIGPPPSLCLRVTFFTLCLLGLSFRLKVGVKRRPFRNSLHPSTQNILNRSVNDYKQHCLALSENLFLTAQPFCLIPATLVFKKSYITAALSVLQLLYIRNNRVKTQSDSFTAKPSTTMTSSKKSKTRNRS